MATIVTATGLPINEGAINSTFIVNGFSSIEPTYLGDAAGSGIKAYGKRLNTGSDINTARVNRRRNLRTFT